MITKIILLVLIHFSLVIFSFKFRYGLKCKSLKLSAAKFDKSNFLYVSVKKPLGIAIEEIEEGKPRGVYISDVGEGNAKATNQIYKGQFIVAINGEDVKYSDFDTIMTLLSSHPSDKPMELTLIDIRAINRGPAILTVVLADGTERRIETVKGTLLRPLLLQCNIPIYEGGAKLTNCGGGGSCGTCVVKVINNADWVERPDFEAKRLKKYDATARLSCNTMIEGDATIIMSPKKIQ
jgi:ferredoxin